MRLICGSWALAQFGLLDVYPCACGLLDSSIYPLRAALRRSQLMTHSLYEPQLLKKIISTKREQLRKIREDLDHLPFEDPSRPRLLELMLYLQKGIPDLEAVHAKRSAQESKGGSTESDSTADSISSNQSHHQTMDIEGGIRSILEKLDRSHVSASAHVKREKKRKPAKRDTVIFAAILRELTGMKYCSFLEDHGIKPKLSDSGPATYPLGYKAGDPWRKKIQDEKTRAKSRMKDRKSVV